MILSGAMNNIFHMLIHFIDFIIIIDTFEDTFLGSLVVS